MKTKHTSKIFALLLAILMVIAIVPFSAITAFAASTDPLILDVATSSSGTGYSWSVDTSAKKATLALTNYSGTSFYIESAGTDAYDVTVTLNGTNTITANATASAGGTPHAICVEDTLPVDLTINGTGSLNVTYSGTLNVMAIKALKANSIDFESGSVSMSFTVQQHNQTFYGINAPEASFSLGADATLSAEAIGNDSYSGNTFTGLYVKDATIEGALTLTATGSNMTGCRGISTTSSQINFNGKKDVLIDFPQSPNTISVSDSAATYAYKGTNWTVDGDGYYLDGTSPEYEYYYGDNITVTFGRQYGYYYAYFKYHYFENACEPKASHLDSNTDQECDNCGQRIVITEQPKQSANVNPTLNATAKVEWKLNDIYTGNNALSMAYVYISWMNPGNDNKWTDYLYLTDIGGGYCQGWKVEAGTDNHSLIFTRTQEGASAQVFKLKIVYDIGESSYSFIEYTDAFAVCFGNLIDVNLTGVTEPTVGEQMNTQAADVLGASGFTVTDVSYYNTNSGWVSSEAATSADDIVIYVSYELNEGNVLNPLTAKINGYSVEVESTYNRLKWSYGTPQAAKALEFSDSSAYDIPSGEAGSAISEIDVSGAAKYGQKPYTFSKESGPSWLNVSADGKITGTRPMTAQAATTATIKVTDGASASKTITIAIGAVSLKTINAIDFTLSGYAIGNTRYDASVVANTSGITLDDDGSINGYAFYTVTDNKLGNYDAFEANTTYRIKVCYTVDSGYELGAAPTLTLGDATFVSNTKSGNYYIATFELPKLEAAINKLTGITITTPPTKTAYVVGENFDKTGMVVTATYEDSSTAPITDYTITNGTALTAGQTTVTISYTENMITKTATVTITVHEHTYGDTFNGKDTNNHWKECTATDCPDKVGSKKDVTAHSESTPATCIAKAICVCGEEIGTFAAHSFAANAWREEVPATCVATGTKAHKDCFVCNKHFEADGITELSDLTIAINTSNHDMATEWTNTDANGHYHSCKRTGCEYHDTLVPHTSSGSATETTPETCTDCGYVITPALGHTCANGLKWKGQEATCTTDGWKDYYKCSCNKLYSDEACTIEIADFDAWKIGDGKIAAGHTPNTDDGDCTTAITCSVCGTETTAAKATHTAGADDGDCTTAVKCTECDKNAIEANATHMGGTATCTAKAKCSVCDTEYGNLAEHEDANTDGKCDACDHDMGITPPPHTHTYGTEWQKNETKHWKDCSCGEKTESAAHTDGNTDGACDACGYAMSVTPPPHTHTYGTWVSDGTNHWKECSCGEKAESAAHSGGTATCTAKAKCSVCEAEYGNLAEHSYSEATCTAKAKCTACGAETGELAEHSYSEATCTAKAKCTACGAETGELAEHKDTDSDGKCDACDFTMSVTPENPENPEDPEDPTDPGEPEEPKQGISGGAIAGIVVGSVVVLGGGGFALFWFVIKKKSFADLIGIFKK